MLNHQKIKPQTLIPSTFEMEKRKCVNEKCTIHFSVLKTSNQLGCSVACEELAGVVRMSDKIAKAKAHGATLRDKIAKQEPIMFKDGEPVFKEDEVVVQAKDKVIRRAPRNAATPTPIQKEKTKEEAWQEAVSEAITIKKAFHKARIEIATKALYACDIMQGGSQEERIKAYDVKDFAQDIGVHHKTLSQWIRIKRYIYDKVGDHWDDFDYTKAMRTERLVSADTSPEDVIRIYNEPPQISKDQDRIIKTQKTIIFLNKKLQTQGVNRTGRKKAQELLESVEELRKTLKLILK